MGGIGRLARFARDEQGSFVVFSLYLLITIFIVTGIAVDVVRYEAQRTRLQNTLDRGILAAADMSQKLDAETVLNSYFEKAGLSGYLSSVTPSTSFNSKTVAATGNGVMNTFFMNWLGIDHLDPVATGTAEESISDIEISLVLDISGSMGEAVYEEIITETRYGSKVYRYNTGQDKLEALQDAASEFVDTIYGATANGRTSMSMVPYASQVNAGPLLPYLNVTSYNTINQCVDFTTAQFSTTELKPTTLLERSDYFDMDSSSSTMSPDKGETCNNSSYARILPMANDPDVVKTAIRNLKHDGNTSVEIGMKWGAALLDPSFQPVVTSMINNGLVSSDFDGRPYAYDNTDTMKVIIVMTDGINTDQYVLNDSFKSQDSGVWRYKYNNQWNYSVDYPEGKNKSLDGDSTNNEKYWHQSRTGKDKYSNSAGYSNATATQLTWRDLWQVMGIKYHQKMRQDIRTGDSHGDDMGTSNVTKKITGTTKDARLLTMCKAAKDEGIIVFAIGFEVTDASADLLKKCATSYSHFYRVQGLQITTAFQSIANAIGKLRLTQ